MTNLGPPNKNVSDAVDVRSELDLRIGKSSADLDNIQNTFLYFLKVFKYLY